MAKTDEGDEEQPRSLLELCDRVADADQEALISSQLMLGRESFWLPEWMLNRSVKAETLCKTTGRLRPAARFIDRFVHRRLEHLTCGPFAYLIATVCLMIAMTMPTMEVVLFAANVAGAALLMFGLSMIGRDGALAIVAFVFTAATMGMVGYGLLA